MKKVLMLSLAIGMMIAVVGHAFAMVQEPPIIEKRLTPVYKDLKPLL